MGQHTARTLQRPPIIVSFHSLNTAGPGSTLNHADSTIYVFTKETGLRETPIVQAKFISPLKGWVLKAGVQLSPLLVIALYKERWWDRKKLRGTA